MKVIILKNNLLEGLVATERAIGDNVNLPILKNVLFKAQNNKISLTTTNLELAITYTLSGKIIESGEITIPHFIFENIVKNLESERISLELKNKQLILITDNYEALIQGQEAKEFPIIPTIKNKKRFLKIPIDYFKEVLGSVITSTQYSEIRPEISGIFINFEDQLTLVATDSFRLAERVLEKDRYESEEDGNFSIILPLKTALELQRILKEQEADLEVFVDPNQILFKTATIELISHLIDGRFPDYKSVIPKQFKTEIFVQRNELISAVRVASSFSGRINDLTLKVGDNKKYLEIYAASSSVGENRYRLPVKLKGEKVSLVLNWRYLLDGLKIFQGEEIMLGINLPDKPISLKSPTEPYLVYVLVPMKV
jgi:DNA polymerase-3 subunit beta